MIAKPNHVRSRTANTDQRSLNDSSVLDENRSPVRVGGEPYWALVPDEVACVSEVRMTSSHDARRAPDEIGSIRLRGGKLRSSVAQLAENVGELLAHHRGEMRQAGAYRGVEVAQGLIKLGALVGPRDRMLSHCHQERNPGLDALVLVRSSMHEGYVRTRTCCNRYWLEVRRRLAPECIPNGAVARRNGQRERRDRSNDDDQHGTEEHERRALVDLDAVADISGITHSPSMHPRRHIA